MSKSIFSKIIDREIPSDIIYEDDYTIVIKDINPQAPIHYLIIPKKSIQNIQDMNSHDFSFGEDVFRIAQYLSRTVEGAAEFKLIMNNGVTAGQEIFHAHVHFLAGY